MLLLKVILLVEMVVSVNCVTCSNTDWAYSFDHAGQSKCKENNYYIRGLDRNNVDWHDDSLQRLEGVQCCSAPPQWSNDDVKVIYADWTHTLDRDYSLATCPIGYFLQGLYRSDSGWPRYMGYLDHLENARCAKPVTHPYYYGSCYDEDINACFDRKGLCSCKDGFYITGIYRGYGDDLYNLDVIRCCTMAEKPTEVTNVEELKTKIMDGTLHNMANLANMLGFGWCYGNRGLNVGEDFERHGDTWVASTSLFWPNNQCQGTKCGHKLNLAFGDWSFAVKGVTYGKVIFDSLEPEFLYPGRTVNNEPTPVTETVEISRNVEDTITHSTTNSWTNSHELGISLNFNIPLIGGGASMTYTAKFEHTSSTTDERSRLIANTLTKKTEKTLAPYSSATYKVLLSKSRTTIPYTAVIIARFSTEFRGFMRYGGGFNSPTTNYHSQYRGSEARPDFTYRFGSQSVPFYTALKQQSNSRSMPWLWSELLKNYPSAQRIINGLTDETQYEFTLTGILEKVSGTHIDVVWEKDNTERIRREITDRNTTMVHNFNETILALPGPNDRPAKVEYPYVPLVKPEPLQFENFPVDKNSE